MENYLVAGLGKTGLSFAKYLHKRNLPFIAYDTRNEPLGLEKFSETFSQVPIYLGSIPIDIISKIKAVLVSPGLPLETPIIQAAREKNIPIYGDIECLAQEITAPIVAITGTNGKSTVTALVGEMARASGYKVAIAGNIGEPVLDKLDDGQSYDLWVLELSSFQLELTQTLKTITSTILNISPDHLDRHHTLEHYIAAKKRIYKESQSVIFNRQDPATSPENQHENCFSFGDDAPKAGEWGLVTQNGVNYLAEGDNLLLPVTELKIKGIHNWVNALAACALATQIGISGEVQSHVLKNFAGLRHRCQWVKTRNHVDWINDSKGTNVGATISAISGIGGSMQGKIVLIAGGQGKGADFTTLRASVGEHVRSVVLIGEDADKMTHALQDIVPIIQAPDLEKAVSLAEALAQPGDVVLLSPACASLDMFRDFNHRGDDFMELVDKL